MKLKEAVFSYNIVKRAFWKHLSGHFVKFPQKNKYNTEIQFLDLEI